MARKRKPKTIKQLADIQLDPDNANEGTPRGRAMLDHSVRHLGAGRSVLVDRDGVLVAGEKTTEAWGDVADADDVIVVQTDGSKLVVVQRTDLDMDDPEDDRGRRLSIADNRVAQVGLQWAAARLAAHQQEGIDLTSLFRDDELAAIMASSPERQQGIAHGSLAERFLVPPFTVLDARQGYWRDRKAAWLTIGVQGELGREGQEAGTMTAYSEGMSDDIRARFTASGPPTSVFDPVLAELCYRWFCPPGGRVLDPFAGEATKGLVAAYLGLDYTGVELRDEQVVVNQIEAEAMGVDPTWQVGDAAHLAKVLGKGAGQFDMVLTSPPYFDLEVYSRRPEDASTIRTYPEFLEWYAGVWKQAARKLHRDRFLVVKVAAVRDKAGAYHDLVGDTVRVLQGLGLHFYNEAILVTPAGSLPVRVGGQFSVHRKLGRQHQNVLVFYKGNPAKLGTTWKPVPEASVDLPGQETTDHDTEDDHDV